MSDTIIHNGDVGTIFRLTITDKEGVAIDVSTATVKKFYFLKPGGTKINKDAEFNTTGVDGKLKYTTVAGDIDAAGTWQIQGYVEISLGKFWTEKDSFKVYSTLATA